MSFMVSMREFTTISGAIFDMDGTILDSSEIWDACTPALLAHWGYQAKPTLKKDVYPLGIGEMASFLKKDYQMCQSVTEIYDYLTGQIKQYYCDEANLKQGAWELLHYLKDHGVTLALATATARAFTEPALELTGVAELFDCVLTCEEVGHTKREPHIFREALANIHTPAQSTWIFEDALHSIQTAKALGLITCGVEDSSAVFQKQSMIETCDFFLEDLRQWTSLPFVQKEAEKKNK